MTVKYKTVITKAGAEKLAAATLPNGKKVNFTAMAVGDGGGKLPEPNAGQTKLVNEVWRHTLNKISQDKKNKNYVVAELVIPPEAGGFWMRETGLYDDAGTLIAVGSMAESYKPELAEGSGRAQTVRMVIMVSDIDTVELAIDTTLVMATQDYVDDKLAEHEQSRRHPDATLKEKGFVQLSSATDSASETLAATPVAVKAAYDLAKGKYTAQDATTAQKGIVQLSSATDSASEVLAATPKAVKAVNDLAKGKYTAQDATTAQKGIVQLSSATDSVSESLAATAKAVKAANDNASGRLAKNQNGADVVDKNAFVKNIGAARAFSASVSTGSRGSWTTAELITWLEAQEAFNHPYWVCKGSWSYANNKTITDTGCGDIQLAGAVIEVMGSRDVMTIRVTTANTGEGILSAQFIYINHGSDYRPGWTRTFNRAGDSMAGTLSQDSVGLGTYNQTALSMGERGGKNYLRKFRGGMADTVWHETVQASTYRLATGSTDSTEVLSLEAGRASFAGEVVSKSANGLRIAYGSIGFFIRNDGGSTYFMLTNANDNMGGYNNLRPVQINNTSGLVTLGKVNINDWTYLDARYYTQSASNARFILADSASYAGFASNNAASPYMRHKDSNAVVGLALREDVYSKAASDGRYQKINTASLGTNGWHKDASTGLITQWGYVAPGWAGYASVTFPIAFPSACINVQVSITGDGGESTVNFSSVKKGTVSRTGAQIGYDKGGAYWEAKGY